MQLPPPVVFPGKPPRRRKRRGSRPASPPAPPAATLLYVYEQQAASSLKFVFDDLLTNVDVSGTQFQATVGGNLIQGLVVDEWTDDYVVVIFEDVVNTATVGTLLDGGGLSFVNGGVAAGGQSQPVTPPPP